MHLVVQDVTHHILECWNFMPFIRNLITLIWNSPKRLACFQEFQSKDAPSWRPLCLTPWIGKAASLQSIASNYSGLIQFLENLCLEHEGNADGKANYLLQNLHKFSTFFSLNLILTFFLCVETAGAALRNSPLYSQKAFQLIIMLCKDIKYLCENGFEYFWKSTNAAANALNVESPTTARPKKKTRRLEDGGTPSHSLQSPEAMYKQQFYQEVDTATTSLDCRFSQSALKHVQYWGFCYGKGRLRASRTSIEMICIKAGRQFIVLCSLT